MRLTIFISPFTLVRKVNDLARIIQQQTGYMHYRFKPRILKLCVHTYSFH